MSKQSKHITTGDGGFAITDDRLLADKMRRSTDKGRLRQQTAEIDTCERLAPNYRMTALQAAVAMAQLEKVKERVNIRYQLGSLLIELISDCAGIALLPVLANAKPS
ncbi:MAG: DegT/DnrJ/EryC1/StrS family aminotransferase [Limnochordia bacterium]|jgi:perosamine synthetase